MRRTADRGLDLDRISAAARQAVTAWVMAINGDDATLAASGEPHMVSFFQFGSEATVDVRLATAPTRYEAADLIAPAIDAEIRRALGEGDWRPNLHRLIVVELLGE